MACVGREVTGGWKGQGAARQGLGVGRTPTSEEAHPRPLQASVALSVKWNPQLLCQCQRKGLRPQEAVRCFPSVR